VGAASWLRIEVSFAIFAYTVKLNSNLTME
jgi:hypothetical protein